MFGLIEGDTQRAGTELYTDFNNWGALTDLCWISEDDLAEELKRAADLLSIIRIGDTPITTR
jgi:hypothetical protein